MTLTEALSSSRLAGAERSAGGIAVLIHCSRQGCHLTRYAPGEAGRPQSQRWVFLNLYDLLVFARTQGFAEVDAEVADWRAVSGSAETALTEACFAFLCPAYQMLWLALAALTLPLEPDGILDRLLRRRS